MKMLSIIVPVYNKEKYIDECIQSLLAQTYTEFELIIVNDGSTDESLLKCIEYAQKDSRIRLIDQQNQGVSAARNKGLEAATGSYIGFIDSDDTIAPDMYEILIKNALEQNADISVCGMDVIMPNKPITTLKYSEKISYTHRDALYMFLKGTFNYSANNKIVRSDIIKQIRFEGAIYEDILFMCKVFLAADVVTFDPIVGYYYRVRNNSTSMSRFGEPYFETIKVSSQIVELVNREDSEVIAAAKAFDVMANISLLNLLLIARKNKFSSTYIKVCSHLNKLKTFIKDDPHVAKKHKYAFLLHNLSPSLYSLIMYLYCLITRSEVITRTRS
ncbi:glycosyltransferase [Mucilaginibacter lutimaris]|uniref:Glycosyltransferase n=1 Tax=Mucilaginibacter lutimaris TaxID=931629 RepID=A0ABW2ZLJ9_9SPHI